MNSIIKALLSNDRGTSSIELGLICALIVLAMMTALQGFADSSISMWENITSKTAEATKDAVN